MTDTLADDIRNAMKETAAVEAEPTPVEATPEPIADAIEPVAEEKTSKRGADGKFLAKEADVVQDAPATGAEAKEPIRPPASWSPTAKAKFASLDPDLQQEVLRREKDMDRGLRERADQLKRYEPLEQVIAPYKAEWAMQGLDVSTVVKTYLEAERQLREDGPNAIRYLARSYGIDLASVAGQGASPQPAAGNAGQPYAQPDPVASELQTLKQELHALKQGREQEVQQTYQSQIEAFASDPANLYFENVKPRMATLLKSGQAVDLPDAYQQAIWSDPTIRPLLLAEQTRPKTDQAREHAARARSAGVSVTGSPAASPPVASNGSIADDIRMAIHQVSGRA